MKKDIGKILGIVVFLALYLMFPQDPAMNVAAVTALMVIWWITEAIPIPATALVPLILFPVIGVLNASEAASPYADKIIFLFMGGFIIAMSMQRWGLHERIALHIIKLMGTSPRRLIFGFMVATAFLSMWISNTATAMMMIPIATAIIATILPNKNVKLDEMDEDQRHFSEAIVLSIAYAASIGGIATIIGTPPNGIFVSQVDAIFPNAPQIGFFEWMGFGVPLVAVFLPIAWLWLTYGSYRHMPKTLSHGKTVIQDRLDAIGPMKSGERWTLLVFVATALCWILRTEKQIGDIIIPGINTFLPFVHDSTIAMAGAVVLFLLPVNRKEGIYTMNWEWAKKIPWGILLLFGGGICLSKAFVASGLAKVIMDQMTIIHGFEIILVVLVIALVVSFLTEVTSNTAMAAIMMPIMAVTAVSMGVHPYILMMTAAFACSFAFMLPVATPPNAVAYGSGYVTMSDMIRSGWVLNLIGVFLITIFMFTIILTVLGIDVFIPEWALNPVIGK